MGYPVSVPGFSNDLVLCKACGCFVYLLPQLTQAAGLGNVGPILSNCPAHFDIYMYK